VARRFREGTRRKLDACHTPGMALSSKGLVERVGSGPFAKKMYGKYWYPFVTRRLRDDDLVCLNWGYEEDPPMGLPLAPADEPNRFCIQLYHRTAAQVDLVGKQVLEISCGHGGGASYLMRTMHPASYTALDLNPAGIAFCRRRHDVPGLEFVQGDAENLPCADQSVDAVINVEASHIYPHFPRFLDEVARVLRPEGHFLYADNRAGADIPAWEAAIADGPLRLLSQEVIVEQVLRGMEKNTPRSVHIIDSHLPTFLRGMARDFAGVEGSQFYRDLQRGDMSYRMYCFAKV
jgi:ubiquinone/menaquinone biosynthesis C-methylase UbiE